MNKVLIFGKDGQLGNDLLQVFKEGYEVIGLGRGDVDITDKEAVEAATLKYRPNVTINATAYNKVDLAESEPENAFSVNSLAVAHLAEASKNIGATFVHVSTDYVFDGSKDFFEENDQPHPLNKYGESKLEGETAAKTAEKYYIIRTSSVFGVKESGQKMNFVDKMISLAKQGSDIKVVNDQVMVPTYSLDLAAKIKELIEKPAAFGTYHITNQGSCSWFEFAQKIFELMNLKPLLTPITVKEAGSKAVRPKVSVLKNSALEKTGISLLPNWQDALHRYLITKYKI